MMKIEFKKIFPRLLEKTRFLLLLITLTGIIVDIFSFHHTPDWVIFMLIAAWLGTIYGWQLEANFSFLGSLVFLTIGQIAVIFQKAPVDYNSPAEKAALWIYVFFAIGLIKRISEYKKPSEPKVKLLDILSLFAIRGEIEKSIKKWSQDRQTIILAGILTGRKESKEYLELVKKWSRYKEISIIKDILTGRKESKGYLELVKKWSSEGRSKVIVTLGFAIEVLKLRIKEFFVYIRNYLYFTIKVTGFRIKEKFFLVRNFLGVVTKVIRLRIKEFFILKQELIKIIFFKLIKFIKVSLGLIFKWTAKETKEFFNFSSSPMAIFLKNRLSIFRQTEMFKYLVAALIDYPILHLIILYLFFKDLWREIKFYRWFFQDSYKFQLISRILPKVLALCLFSSLLAVIFYKFRSKINVEELRGKVKKGLPRLIINLVIFYLGLETATRRQKEISGQLSDNYQPGHGRWLFLITFLLIIYWGENRIFYVQRDKFEFRPFITKVYYDIASRYSEVIIYGHNFRDLPFKGKVFINGNEQKVTNWSDKKVEVETDPILSKTGDFKLVNNYGFGNNVKSNTVSFIFFDGESNTPTEEKNFWETLKELARIRSELYEKNENF